MASEQIIYKVSEVAELMGFSRRSVVRLFQNEPGILIRKGKRRTIRIPKTVYERVLRRLTVR